LKAYNQSHVFPVEMIANRALTNFHPQKSSFQGWDYEYCLNIVKEDFVIDSLKHVFDYFRLFLIQLGFKSLLRISHVSLHD
jgi:hypothetical protein